MIRLFSFILVFVALLSGCKTNPPTSADKIPTGNVLLNISVDNSASIALESKVVLIEDFANVSCNPCVTSNIIIEKLANKTYGRTKLVAVKFPTNFPAPNDLFYIAAKEYCDSRISYYNVFFAPTTVIDGIIKPLSTDSISIKAAIDTRLSVTSRFDIIVDAILEGDYMINVKVKFLDTIGINMNDLIIYSIITETDIEFEQAPGSNGETKFFDVTRLMLPSKEGTSVRQLADQGELSFQFDDALLSSWSLEKINTVVFVQDKTTKEIFQTGSTFE